MPAVIQRAVAQLARVPVSKTGGWGFESLLPCELARNPRAGAGASRLFDQRYR